jgi:hypothetical protein
MSTVLRPARIGVFASLILAAATPSFAQGKLEPPYWYDDADDQATVYFLSSDDVPAGGYLAIYGDDLRTGGSVTLNGASAPVVLWTARRVVITVPTGATGPIVVSPTGGTASAPYPVTITAGRVLHLDKNAPAGGNGSAGSPWNSFATADTNAKPGDQIIVHAGTYTGSGDYVFHALKAGTATSTITYIAKPGDTVVVDGGTVNKEAIRVDASYVSFVGFVARGSKYQNILLQSPNARAVDNEAKEGDGAVSTKGQGINIGGAGSQALGNYCHDNYSHGFYANASNMVIAYNYVATSGCCGAPSQYGYGIQVFMNPGVDFFNPKVYRNYVTSSHRSGIVIGQYSNGADVYENVLKANTESGVVVNYGAKSTRIRNNTIVDNDPAAAGYYAIRAFANPGAENGRIVDGVEVRDNVVRQKHVFEKEAAVTNVSADYDLYDTNAAVWKWGSTSYATLSAWISGAGQDAHGKSAVPGFKNAASNDYRPATGSPMIDAGDNATCARPVQGAACDDGAFESSGGQQNPPPATPQNLHRTDRH